ncbi:MAG TPA: biotin/lipoyl-containing protein [Planctomycetota bacterium]|nr:biotin/lipoyl-containing protein [Planctomycetota bacterium]
MTSHSFVLRSQDDASKSIAFTLLDDGSVSLSGRPAERVKVLRRDGNGLLTVLWGEEIINAIVVGGGERGELLQISRGGECQALRLRDAAIDAMEQALAASHQSGGTLDIRSPIPGLVKALLVKPGDTVSAKQTLIVLEAMKMENEIIAPHEGTVVSVDAQLGQAVAAGALLVKIQT